MAGEWIRVLLGRGIFIDLGKMEKRIEKRLVIND